MSYDSPDTITDGVRLKVIESWMLYEKRAQDSQCSSLCSSFDSYDLQTLITALFYRPKSQTRR